MRKEVYNDVLTMPEVIGVNLKALRMSCDLSLGDVAALSGLSVPFLSLVETGKRNIKPMILRTILLHCGYTLGFFISELQQSLENDIERNGIVVHKGGSILLDGSRDSGKYMVRMFRTVETAKSEQLLNITMPPEVAMHHELLTINSTIRGVVSQGTVLLDFGNDEHVVKEGEEFKFDGNNKHILRNYTQTHNSVYLWVESGGF
ncbi:MAG: helix-turn-helix domain-containing protein [Candidatus Kapabacteria bacterium]|nr:helix-turn-helix domain-containing protein [Candidatus Kapabacteria bacterium]